MKVVFMVFFYFFGAVPAWTYSFEQQLSQHELHAKYSLMENISPSDALPGTVIASPSRHNPDYYYHWVRDAALVMQVVLNLYEEEKDYLTKEYYLQRVRDFVSLTALQQKNSGFEGIGEPKYYVDGRPYDGPWGRPQNDGPALRASVLIRFAEILQTKGEEITDEHKNAIVLDLEYVLQKWPEANFDLWEEVQGDHFYTRFVQRKALLDGQKWAGANGLYALSESCRRELAQLELTLHEFKDNQRHILKVTTRRTGGLDYKYSGLDTANILAVLHADNADGVYSPGNSWVLNTAQALQESFAGLYPINAKFPHLGTAFGRYPEDQYYGGNPWFLTTFAVAELYYRAAVETKDFSFIEHGDHLLRRGLFHSGHGGTMDEQMNLHTGFMESARDLTWSYASYLTALRARRQALSLKNDSVGQLLSPKIAVKNF